MGGVRVMGWMGGWVDEAVGVYEGLGILTDHGLRGTIERYVQAGALSDLKFQTRGTVGFKSLPSINFPPAEVFSELQIY